MKPKALRKLIAGGESQSLDFKQVISHPQKIAKTMVAFANTIGGQILLGVTDQKAIAGVDPEEQEYLLFQAADFFCDPPVHLSVGRVEDEHGRVVLVVEIPESDKKPHFVVGHDTTRTAYVRMDDHSVMASKANLQQMKGGERTAIPLRTQEVNRHLIHFIRKHGKITLVQYCRLMNYSERRAKRQLTELTSEGFLLLHDFEKEIFYTLAFMPELP